MSDDATAKTWNIERSYPDGPMPAWQPHAAELCELLSSDLRHRGLAPDVAPELPPHLEQQGLAGEIRGPFRVLCAYALYSVVPCEPYVDEDGDERTYTYGPPEWRLRVSTIAKGRS